MNNACRKYSTQIFLFLFILIFQSCKTDEFKFEEVTIKEDFGINIITPLYTGKDKQGDILDFHDFVHDWKKPIGDPSGPITVLRYADNTFKTIPTRLIFEPSSIIDSLAFLIDGEYELENVELIFNVANSCPFPLNLQLQFIKGNIIGPPITPPAFLEADFNQIPVTPITTTHNVKLDSLQTKSLVKSKRLKLSSWYDQTDYINNNDTLSANYPIDLSIVLIGIVKASNE